MQDHYAIRPFSRDRVVVKGYLDVSVAPFLGFVARLTGLLVPYAGTGIPTVVEFSSDASGALIFDRTLSFPNKGVVHFTSRMEWVTGNELIEVMRFGIGWRLAYDWTGEKMTLSHKGYVWRVAGLTIPLPLSWLLGKGYAEESPFV